MKIAKKREAGSILERNGISSRIIALANDIADGTYKNAIEKAGRIAELVDAATYDEYWDSKASLGKQKEQAVLHDLVEGHVDRGRAISFVNPYIGTDA